MHVLDRPHLAHAAAITAACAALAVVLTPLLFAGTLSDLGSISASASPAAAPASVRSTATEPGWRLSPFTSLLRSSVPVPWSAGS